MSKKLGLLILRGSGDTGFNRQEKFLKKLFKKLKKNGIDTSQIHYEFGDWYGPLQFQQDLILERMNSGKVKLGAKMTRKLIISNIDDLITYGGKPNMPSEAYEKTHKLVHRSILDIKDNVVNNAPLIIVASSMGTEIINNYIWDRQHASDSDPLGNSPFERFETLVGLFTFGHNLPIFASSNNIDDLKPITFPSPSLPPQWQSLAVWENYYDKNDSMGYPIKLLNTNYASANVKDIHINVGNPLTFWNFLSHFGYWTSGKLVKRLSDYICRVFTIE